mmetsp:Transcript_4707/g.6954  ORF Transcript_4707/g.6954 Transcript_4707/m.6954 type:complete len:216 (-) Transcript_4707:264-911(-)
MNSKLIVACILLRLLPISALEAHIYYENAECIDDDTIKGTYVLSYDSTSDKYQGFTWEHYHGKCMHFYGGYLNLHDMNYNIASYSKMIGFGSCVECDGMVGCSSGGDCDTFMTYPLHQKYQLGEDGSGTDEISGDTYSSVNSYLMNTVMESQQTPAESYLTSSVVGGGVFAAMLVGLVFVLEISRRVKEEEKREHFRYRNADSKGKDECPTSDVL